MKYSDRFFPNSTTVIDEDDNGQPIYAYKYSTWFNEQLINPWLLNANTPKFTLFNWSLIADEATRINFLDIYIQITHSLDQQIWNNYIAVPAEIFTQQFILIANKFFSPITSILLNALNNPELSEAIDEITHGEQTTELRQTSKQLSKAAQNSAAVGSQISDDFPQTNVGSYLEAENIESETLMLPPLEEYSSTVELPNTESKLLNQYKFANAKHASISKGAIANASNVKSENEGEMTVHEYTDKSVSDAQFSPYSILLKSNVHLKLWERCVEAFNGLTPKCRI